jgi:hypothetical protein
MNGRTFYLTTQQIKVTFSVAQAKFALFSLDTETVFRDEFYSCACSRNWKCCAAREHNVPALRRQQRAYRFARRPTLSANSRVLPMMRSSSSGDHEHGWS